jgi:uncharacterized protein
MRLAISISLVLLCLVSACSPILEEPKEPKACFESKCFTVEVADTSSERSLGLMYREYLAPDRGMLFIFDSPGKYRFWMKNTRIPLDIIWMDSKGKVTYISADTPPCLADPCPSYGPSSLDTNLDTKYVLELNAGAANEFSISPGSIATHLGG